MKYGKRISESRIKEVVPRVGTWIEIIVVPRINCPGNVVPRVGTWIEIVLLLSQYSVPEVVPRVGTWIEMGMYKKIC